MKMIYKYPLNLDSRVVVKMPAGAEVLAVQVQRSTPCLWAVVDPEAPVEVRYFKIFGTGQPLDERGRYVGTFQMCGGDFIWHVFEE